MHNPILRNSDVLPGAAGVAGRDAGLSLWQATGNPAPALPELRESVRADVAVVGGGYLGLACALQLAEAGADAVLLEAESPGFGASGRNGGQVIPGLKYDPDELRALYGAGPAEAMIDFAGRTADRVFDTVARYGMDCDAVRHGWIQGAHNETMLRTTRRRAAQWQACGADVELLDGEQIGRMVGSAPGLYRGGWIDRRAGSVHPLNYARGLADAAAARGARLYQQSAARRIERAQAGWRIATDRGQVQAGQVVIATNAYTDDLWPGLRTSVVPALSSQIATEPLPAALRETILPGRQAVSDARRLLHYYRLDAAGRLVIGGRGPLSDRDDEGAYRHIRRALASTFPQLADAPLPYRWSGRLAMTRDGMPHLHRPAPGLTMALGCNGRGVALTTAVGQAIAGHLLAGDASPLPFAATPIVPIPFHRMHRVFVSLMVQYYKIRDLF